MFTDPGMTVFSDYRYLTATTDLQIHRECHGSGLVEIKYLAILIGKMTSTY